MTDPVQTQRPTPQGSRWQRPLLVATTLLLLVVLALAARAGPYTDRIGTGTGSAAATGTSAVPRPPREQPRDPRGDLPEDFGELPGVHEFIPANVVVVFITIVLVVFMSLGVLLMLGLIPVPTRWRQRHAAGAALVPEIGRARAPRFAAAVDEALDVIEHGTAGNAVIGCWLLLIRTATEAGSPPRPSETSREYAARLAAEQLISAAPLERLAELYREARFSEHPVRHDLRVQARRALGVLQTELGSGVRL